jgi:NAD(P)-dependent dehydrogenase (short-subunit alcohol dehydrogenase family)
MTGTGERERPNLDGQVALITGGGRGIGRALAQALAAAGAAVAIVARSTDQLTETIDLIASAGGRAMARVGDVSDRETVETAVREVERAFSPVDLLINNAAVVIPLGPIAEIDPDAWWRCQEINVRGPLLCSRMVLPGMYARGRGRIVNMVTTIVPIANMSAYMHSKAALVWLSELLALEGRSHGVRVFAVSPGAVRTEMTGFLMNSVDGRKWMPSMRPQFEAIEMPVQRVASLMLIIASGGADHLAGRLLSARDDFEQVEARAADIEREGLYTLRIRTLQELPAP